ncbi:MAG: PtsA [Clostridia bacterium]|jgi:phosphotransferase system enzyme I (PtsI)|nr:PtsA [Clostridia bacterium]
MNGIAASQGIAIAKAYVYEKVAFIIDEKLIQEADISSTLERIEAAKEMTKEQLKAIGEKARASMGEEEGKIFETHMMLVEDPIIEQRISEHVTRDLKNAEAAVQLAMTEISEMFLMIEDPYLRERSADVVDVCTRMMYNLANIEMPDLSHISEEVIIIANDLTPSDTAQMNPKYIKGFATNAGGKTSHSAIMARTLEIPAVLGLKNITEAVETGDWLIINGAAGEVILNPNEVEIETYKALQSQLEGHKKELQKLLNEPAITKDGHLVELSANIGTPKDIESALKHGAEGIGLFRTEFLYMDRNSLPTESEQFEYYKEVAEGMKGRPVIVRTLDIGGDKSVPYLDIEEELNPFLGWRAIRMCLDKVSLFKTQLKAILRASYYGKLRIMYPMITHIEQVRQANDILEQAKAELREQQIPFDEAIEVGIMIETPAAAVIADLLIKEVDFFSIGTNDLTQYTLAVDRGNEKIAKLYNSFHPGVLRLIKQVIQASHKAGKWTGMCGEFASDPKAVIVLLGMGLDEFSMSASSILEVKEMIRKLTFSQAAEIAEAVTNKVEVEAIENYLARFAGK